VIDHGGAWRAIIGVPARAAWHRFSALSIPTVVEIQKHLKPMLTVSGMVRGIAPSPSALDYRKRQWDEQREAMVGTGPDSKVTPQQYGTLATTQQAERIGRGPLIVRAAMTVVYDAHEQL
jgi:hypothetical protein